MKVTIDGHIDHRKNQYGGKDEYAHHRFDMSEFGWVKVMDYPLEIEAPDDFDPRPQQIAALQAEKAKLHADFAARCTQIERQISELTCLEFSPSEAV